jgi:hypothetical protein
MQSLLFVMAIMGCGESDAACREVRIDQQRFQSAAACRAATDSALIRHSDLDFPTVVARCRQANARPQLLRGSEVLLPAPDPGRARVRVAAASRTR